MESEKMTKKYHVQLTIEQRKQLKEMLSRGKTSARLMKRANILLALDENSTELRLPQREIAKIYHVNYPTVNKIAKEYAELGFDATITYKRNPEPPVKAIVTGDVEAKLIQLACSQAPDGRSSWSLRLLAQKAVELEIIDHICPETVRKTLKKTNLNRI